jgi:hypothetical protein
MFHAFGRSLVVLKVFPESHSTGMKASLELEVNVEDLEAVYLYYVVLPLTRLVKGLQCRGHRQRSASHKLFEQISCRVSPQPQQKRLETAVARSLVPLR